MGCYYTLISIFVLTVVVTLGVNKVEFIMQYLTQKSGSVNQIKNRARPHIILLYVFAEKLKTIYGLSDISRVLLLLPNGNAVHFSVNDHTQSCPCLATACTSRHSYRTCY